MSSSSMCQTVYDTIRTVVYDTVHTSVFDTVHTVSFDTVHSLVYDSAAVTVQALRDSQAFYSNSFNYLITVAAIIAALFGIVVTWAWNRQVTKELDKFKNECERIANNSADIAAKKSREELDGLISEQKKNIENLKIESVALWTEQIMDLYSLSILEKESIDVVSKLCTIIIKLSVRFEKNLFNFVNENLIDELSKHIMNLKPERGYDGLLERIKEDVIALRNTVEKRNLDISETKKTIDKIDSFIALLERLKNRFIKANQ